MDQWDFKQELKELKRLHDEGEITDSDWKARCTPPHLVALSCFFAGAKAGAIPAQHGGEAPQDFRATRGAVGSLARSLSASSAAVSLAWQDASSMGTLAGSSGASPQDSGQPGGIGDSAAGQGFHSPQVQPMELLPGPWGQCHHTAVLGSNEPVDG